MASCIFFFHLLLSISSLLLFPASLADGTSTATISLPLGTIQRKVKQQILATIPPNPHEVSLAPFLTSPSGKYTGYLLRRTTVPEAGGLGNDFCYIQIQDTASGASVWESECAAVSSANTCDLVLCDAGIAVFDGSRSAWDTSGSNNNNNFPASLELVDLGDMRVIDKDGELVWRASDDPRVNQGCGLPGGPGQVSGSPPFAAPIGGYVYPPFGQQDSGALPLPLPPVSTPVVAPVAGDDASGEADQQLSPVSTPVVAPVAGNDASGEADQQLSPVSTPVVAPVAGNDASGEADQQLSPVPPPVEGEAPSYPSNSIGAFGQQQQPPLVHGFGAQHPLVDNTPYDSGSSRKEASMAAFFAVAGLLLVRGL